MKLLIYSDVHWCKTSSIVKAMGEKYSIRLNHLIDSVNWAENLAEEHKCDMVINLGDFFNSYHIDDSEVSALSEIKWANVPHKYVMGNHEIQNKNKELSSAHIFKLLGFDLITNPKKEVVEDIELCYLPYMFEYDELNTLFDITDKKRIVFSHNDVKGVQVGGYIFDNGFDLEDIAKNCNLFLNGHIHAKGVYDNMINVGNLCGQNFGENGVPHNAYILDTDTMDLQEFENPYSLNFYKINCTNRVYLPKLRNNPVLTIKCSEDNIEDVRNAVSKVKDLIEVKYSIIPKVAEAEEIEYEDIIQIDHLKALQEFVIEKLGDTDIVREELNILST